MTQIILPEPFKQAQRRIVHFGVGEAEELVPRANADPNSFYLGVDASTKLGLEAQGGLPHNAAVLRGTRADQLLKAIGKEELAASHAAFFYCYNSTSRRAALLTELGRVLAPQGKATFIETAPYQPLLVSELSRAGFQVESRLLTPQELVQLHSTGESRDKAANTQMVHERLKQRFEVASINPNTGHEGLNSELRRNKVDMAGILTRVENQIPYEQIIAHYDELVEGLQAAALRKAGARVPVSSGLDLRSLAKKKALRRSPAERKAVRPKPLPPLSPQARAAIKMVSEKAWMALTDRPFTLVTATKK